jgi:hypothetical protein
MSDNDKQCCKTVFGERVTSWPCQRPAKFTFEGKRYCTVHYPPNVEKRRQEAMEKYRAKLGAKSAKYTRQNDCLSACEGVTFTGDPTGIVKRMAETLQGMISDYAERVDYDTLSYESARALLAQVRIEAEPPEADADKGE